MQQKKIDEILNGWLDGSENAHGMENPAGPLYVDGKATEAALTDANQNLMTGCSSCSASLHTYCC